MNEEQILEFLRNEAIEMIAALEHDISISIYDGKKGHDPEAEAELEQWKSALMWLEHLREATKMTQPSEDLEQAAWEYASKECEKAAFIAGAQWQKEQDTRDMYMSDNRHFYKVYELGKKDMKEQMMKEAKEADVNIYKDLVAGVSWAEFVVEMPVNSLGEKERIIIVKED